MPKRMLHEGILTSETIDALSADEERTFYRLMVACDDFGRFDARPAILRARLYPLKIDSITADQVRAWVARLAEVGLISLYDVEGRLFGAMNTWEKHQRIRNKFSQFPAPCDGSPSIDSNPPQSAAKCLYEVEVELQSEVKYEHQYESEVEVKQPQRVAVCQEEVRVFLEVYPPTLKRQENAVWKAYQVARRLVSADDILEGARQYAQHVADTDTTPQFTKSAVRWLEEEGWTAQYAKPQEKSLHGNYSPDEVAI